MWRWSTAEIYVRAAGLADAHMSVDGALVGTIDIPAGGHRDIVVELSTSGTDRDRLGRRCIVGAALARHGSETFLR